MQYIPIYINLLAMAITSGGIGYYLFAVFSGFLLLPFQIVFLLILAFVFTVNFQNLLQTIWKLGEKNHNEDN